MSERKSLPVALLLIAGLSASTIAGARADDKCLVKPNAPAPQGQHWYYRHDHAKRQCWYLREQGLPVRKHAPQAETKPAPQAAARPTVPQDAQPQPVATTAAPPADGKFSAAAAPVPFLDVTNLSIRATAARPAQPAARVASPQSADAGDDPPPARGHVAAGVSDPPPAADKPVATGAIDGPSPAGDRVRKPPQRAAAPLPAPAPIEAAAEPGYAFALFMLLFVGLAIGGPALHYGRRRRAREDASFRPPPWARVVALNAPTPRIRVPRPRKDALAQPAAAPPLAPADRTQNLALMLQQLADRLRADQEPAPSIVPHPARPMSRAARHEAGAEVIAAWRRGGAGG